MAQELIYTSAPRGLRKGSSGFCTVACTRGMAPNYIETLESLSGYTAVFAAHDRKARLNPVASSHYQIRIGGKQVNILSRVAFTGVDHTQRTNKLAYHIVLDARERARGGPAWMLQQEGVMLTQWQGEPQYLDRKKQVPDGDSSPAVCDTWRELTDDAGWAGVLAQAFLNDPRQASFIIFEPGTDVLALIAEALRLLPPEMRWDVTFNTYFTSLPLGTDCAWRCCLPDASALRQARRMRGALVLDLTAGANQPEEAMRRMEQPSPLIQCARDGTPPPAGEAPPAEEGVEAPARATIAAPPALKRVSGPATRPPGAPPEQWTASVPRRRRRVSFPMGVVAIVLGVLLLVAIVTIVYLVRSRPDFEELAQEVGVPGEAAPSEEAPDPGPAEPGDAEGGAKPAPSSPEETGVPKPQQAPEEKPGEAEGEPTLGTEQESEPKEPTDPEEQPPPPLGAPTTRYVLRLVGGAGGLADSVRLGAAEYKLPVEGITEGWQLKEIQNWDGRKARLGAGITRKQSGGGIELWGRSAGTGLDMVFVSIQPQKDHVAFERKDRLTADKANDCLGDVAWVELYCEATNETVLVLTKPLEKEVRLEVDGPQGGQKPKLKATIEVPGRFELACREFGATPSPTSLEDEAEYHAALKTELSAHKLTISVEYSYETLPEIEKAVKDWEEAKEQYEPSETQLKDAQKVIDDAEAERKRQEKFITDAKQAWNKAIPPQTKAEKDLRAAEGHLQDVTTGNAPKHVQDTARHMVNTSLKARNKARDELQKKKGEYENTEWERRPYVDAATTQRDQAKAAHQTIYQGAKRPRDKRKQTRERKEFLENQENQNRASGFGDFSAPLEFKVEDQVIATFRLKPPPS